MENLLSFSLHLLVVYTKILSCGLNTRGYFKDKYGYYASTHMPDLWITYERGTGIS